MKKLYLTSFVFTTGSNEYKEQRIVVVTKEDREEYLKHNKLEDDFDLIIATRKLEIEFKDEYPESKLLSVVAKRTIDVNYTNDSYFRICFPKEKRINMFEESRVRKLLHEFWNFESDMCPLEATQMEQMEIKWDGFISKQINK